VSADEGVHFQLTQMKHGAHQEWVQINKQSTHQILWQFKIWFRECTWCDRCSRPHAGNELDSQLCAKYHLWNPTSYLQHCACQKLI
jgi:hypothetical protein